MLWFGLAYFEDFYLNWGYGIIFYFYFFNSKRIWYYFTANVQALYLCLLRLY